MTTTDPMESGGAFGVRRLSMTFGNFRVLHDVEMSFGSGEVHVLAGHNGSGKSTLIRTLSGYYSPDADASFRVDGVWETWADGHNRAADRMRFVHQDLALIPGMTVAENLALGGDAARRYLSRTSTRSDCARARHACTQIGIELNPATPVSSLSPVERTMLAVARACTDLDPSRALLVLDEPTATLPANEVTALFDLIRRLASAGTAVVLVTHAIDEILKIADRVTVLREGHVVGTHTRAELDRPLLVREIAGEQAGEPLSSSTREQLELGGDQMMVTELSNATLRGVRFTLHAGEVIGVAGLEGSGRESLAAAVAGAIPDITGSVHVDGVPIPTSNVGAAQRGGIAYVPADRGTRGVIGTLTAAENLTLSAPVRRRGLGRVHLRRDLEDATNWFEQLAVHPKTPQRPLSQFSGGNQQKVVVARALRIRPKVLVLDEPTQGVDVGATQALHSVIRATAANGAGVLICSSDLEELASVCDRVLVLVDGEVSSELTGRDIDPTALLYACLQEPTRPL